MSKVLTVVSESSDPQHPCPKPGLAAPIWEAGTAGSQELARQPTEPISEFQTQRQTCLKESKGKNNGRRYLLLTSTCSGTGKYTYI